MITSVGTTEIKIIEAVRMLSISYAKSPPTLLRMVTRTIPVTNERLKNQRTFSNLVNTSFKATPLINYSLFLFNKTISLTSSNIFKTYYYLNTFAMRANPKRQPYHAKQKPIVCIIVGIEQIIKTISHNQ